MRRTGIRRQMKGRIRRMHVHLDPLGGVAGDMFAAALVDARPDLDLKFRDCEPAAGFLFLHLPRPDGVIGDDAPLIANWLADPTGPNGARVSRGPLARWSVACSA